MRTFARFLLVGTILLAWCAWATEPSPVAVGEERVSEARLSNLCDCELSGRKLDRRAPARASLSRQSNRVRAFGEITKKIAQGAFS